MEEVADSTSGVVLSHNSSGEVAHHTQMQSATSGCKGNLWSDVFPIINSSPTKKAQDQHPLQRSMTPVSFTFTS